MWIDRTLASLIRVVLKKDGDSPMDLARLLGALAVLEHAERTESLSDQEEDNGEILSQE